MPELSQNRLGMVLNAENRKRNMFEPHNKPVVRAGVNFQRKRNGIFVDRQGVIASHFEILRQTLVQRGFRIKNQTGSLSVKRIVVLYDFRAENACNALLTEAYAQYFFQTDKLFYHGRTNACIFGCSGAGRQNYRGKFEIFYFGQGKFVVFDDNRTNPEFANVLDNVVGERVVIIDYKHNFTSFMPRTEFIQ